MQKLIYNLYAVIIHDGDLDSGHYYSYCKNQEEWFEFNDSTIKPVLTKKVINNKNAYILFY